MTEIPFFKDKKQSSLDQSKKTDEIIVSVERMFPNCGKYPKGCLPKTGCKAVPNTIDSTLHIPTQMTYTLETRKHIKPPKGFEGW